MFEITIKAYSRIGIATLCQLRAPGSIPSEVSNFYTISSVIGITTTISDNISCMWSKVDNFSCYFSTNSRENFPTNLLLFQTREISKGVLAWPFLPPRKRNRIDFNSFGQGEWHKRLRSIIDYVLDGHPIDRP